MADILKELSHDSVNRFLLRECYKPKDLFEEVKSNLNLIGGTFSVDEKPDPQEKIPVGAGAGNLDY